jgi:hypothetical protein
MQVMGSTAGKYLMIIGGAILIIGVVIYFFGGSLRWLGRLPGDIRIEKENSRFYFPITTLILLNVLIFLLVRVWQWLK